MSQQEITASPAQLRYANLLYYGSLAGSIMLLISYFLYVFGILEPYVPMDKLVQTWHLGSEEFNKVHNIPSGWGWATLLHTGDFSNFIGLAVLAGITIPCYIQLGVDFLRSKQTLMASIAIAEVVVLLIAASGIVGSGGH